MEVSGDSNQICFSGECEILQFPYLIGCQYVDTAYEINLFKQFGYELAAKKKKKMEAVGGVKLELFKN